MGYKFGLKRPLLEIALAVLLFSSIPFMILVCILFGVYRIFVQILVRIFRRDLLAHVRGPGIPMALEHLTVKNSKFNVIVVAILEGNLSLDEVLKIVEKRAKELQKPNGDPIYEELHQYWENFMGYLFWKWDENFDLKNHVRNFEEDHLRENQPLYEKDLEGILSELMPQKWVEGRSPWEALRISNFFPKGKNEPHVAFVIRFHHALGDGFSFKKLFEDFGGVSFKTPQMTQYNYKWWKKILRYIILAIRLPYDMAKQMVNSVDGENSLHLLGEKMSREYLTCVMDDYVPTMKVKDISSRWNVKYTSVLYSVMTGAIRKVVENSNMEVPKTIACLVPTPLPFRPEGLINHMWVFSLTLPLSVKNHKERLKIINDQFQSIHMNGTVLAFLIAYKIMFILPSFLVSFGFNRIQSTMGSSAFPGPELQIDDYLGSKLIDVFFYIGNPSGKMGLVGCTMSSMGRQHFMYLLDKTLPIQEDTFSNIGKLTAQEIHDLHQTEEGEFNQGFVV